MRARKKNSNHGLSSHDVSKRWDGSQRSVPNLKGFLAIFTMIELPKAPSSIVETRSQGFSRPYFLLVDAKPAHGSPSGSCDRGPAGRLERGAILEHEAVITGTVNSMGQMSPQSEKAVLDYLTRRIGKVYFCTENRFFFNNDVGFGDAKRCMLGSIPWC